MTENTFHTGGCQCGAVRYVIRGEPTGPHICHCRMCQKAFGSYFAPLAGVMPENFEWTKGAPAVFQSSAVAERGFCSACGTPLTFHFIDRPKISISLGSLDDPARVKPARQYGIESRMPWFDELHALPGETTDDSTSADILSKLKSHQHPDE